VMYTTKLTLPDLVLEGKWWYKCYCATVQTRRKAMRGTANHDTRFC